MDSSSGTAGCGESAAFLAPAWKKTFAGFNIPLSSFTCSSRVRPRPACVSVRIMFARLNRAWRDFLNLRRFFFFFYLTASVWFNVVVQKCTERERELWKFWYLYQCQVTPEVHLDMASHGKPKSFMPEAPSWIIIFQARPI